MLSPPRVLFRPPALPVEASFVPATEFTETGPTATRAPEPKIAPHSAPPTRVPGPSPAHSEPTPPPSTEIHTALLASPQPPASGLIVPSTAPAPAPQRARPIIAGEPVSPSQTPGSSDRGQHQGPRPTIVVREPQTLRPPSAPVPSQARAREARPQEGEQAAALLAEAALRPGGPANRLSGVSLHRDRARITARRLRPRHPARLQPSCAPPDLSRTMVRRPGHGPGWSRHRSRHHRTGPRAASSPPLCASAVWKCGSRRRQGDRLHWGLQGALRQARHAPLYRRPQRHDCRVGFVPSVSYRDKRPAPWVRFRSIG